MICEIVGIFVVGIPFLLCCLACGGVGSPTGDATSPRFRETESGTIEVVDPSGKPEEEPGTVIDWFDRSKAVYSGSMKHGTCHVDVRYWLYRSPKYLTVVTEFVFKGEKPVSGEEFTTMATLKKAKAVGIEVSVDSAFIVNLNSPSIKQYWNKIVRKGDIRRGVTTRSLPDRETESVLVYVWIDHKKFDFSGASHDKWHPIADFISVSDDTIRRIN